MKRTKVGTVWKMKHSLGSGKYSLNVMLEELPLKSFLNARHHATCSFAGAAVTRPVFQMGRQTEAQRTGVTSQGHMRIIG